MNEELEINIGKIITTKTGKKIPRFAIRLLEKIIHADEINDILKRYGHLSGTAFLSALLSELSIEVKWRNPEALPKEGRAIFVCNHPLGAIDGVGLSHLLAERYGKVQYLVNDMLYYLKPLQPVFLPVNTYGSQKKSSVERIQQALEGDSPIGSFPAGYCSKYYDGQIQDKVWKHSFINMAVTYRRDIIPLHFVARNSQRFYLIDRLWRKLGLKFDLCTALLPDEMFRARGKQFEVIVGEPISWQSLAESSEKPQQLAHQIRLRSYNLCN